MFKILIKNPHRVDERVTLTQRKVLIGRAKSCDLILFSGSISRRHCRLDWHPNGPILIDYEATNGVFLSSQRLSGETQLRKSETLTLAEFTLYIETLCEEPAQETSAEDLRRANSLDASTEELTALAKRSPQIRRLLATRADIAASILKTLAASYDDQTLRALVQNPNTPPEALIELGELYPSLLESNPAYPLLLLENPHLLQDD